MKKTRIIHISDSHFGTVYPETLTVLQTKIKVLAPDLVILTGDITQRARIQQFRAAHKFLTALSPIPFAVIPGNHDIPLFNLVQRFTTPYLNYRIFFKSPKHRFYHLDDVGIHLLNSTSRWRHIQGDFEEKKLRKHFRQNKNATCTFRIAALHHPMACSKNSDLKNLLKNRDQAMAIFQEHNIDLVLAGHIHDPYTNLSNEFYPDNPRKLIISTGGTCCSWRVRSNAPNSFSTIDFDFSPQKTCTLKRYELENNHFVQKTDQSYVFNPSAKTWANL